jgi:hypothetical protein
LSKQTVINFLTLFTSTGTLICCALPALLVALGMGAVLAGLVSDVPQIVWLSENKGIVFTVAGLMLALAGAANYYSNSLSCPTDPVLAEACKTTRKWSTRIYILSVLIFVVGATFAFGPLLVPRP